MPRTMRNPPPATPPVMTYVSDFHELLSLSQEEGDEIRKFIRKVIGRLLNDNKPLTQQSATALERYCIVVKDKYPVLDTPTGHRCLYWYTGKMLKSRIHCMKKRFLCGKSTDSDGNSVSEDAGSDKNDAVSMPRHQRALRSSANFTNTSLGTTASNTSKSSASAGSAAKDNKAGSADRYNRKTQTRILSGRFTSTNTRSPPPPSSHSRSRSPARPEPTSNVNYVLAFLRACEPACTRLLAPMLALGITNNATLHSIARLSEKDIDILLTEMSLGTPLSRQERKGLKKAFAQFLDSSNGL